MLDRQNDVCFRAGGRSLFVLNGAGSAVCEADAGLNAAFAKKNGAGSRWILPRLNSGSWIKNYFLPDLAGTGLTGATAPPPPAAMAAGKVTFAPTMLNMV